MARPPGADRPRRSAPDLRLLVITDAALAAPRKLEDVVIAALQAGAPALQLRDKTASAADLLDQALRFRDITRRFGALLFINDRLDVALAAGADGAHLGPDDLPVAAARAAVEHARAAAAAARHPLPLPTPFLLGVSTDDPDVARAAEREGADYIGCGAVFGTTSKPGLADERIGTQRLAAVVRAVRIPVVGIGGITPANVGEVADAGAAGAAVIGAVMAAGHPGRAVHDLLAAFPRPDS